MMHMFFFYALIRPEVHFLWPTEGKYYLVDSGYLCIFGFLPPYQGELYHLQEYRDRHSRLSIKNFLSIDIHLFQILLKVFWCSKSMISNIRDDVLYNHPL